MPNDLHRRIVGKLLERYDQRLIDNVDRGPYVECMIALALSPAWVLPGGVWNAYDLEHSESGARMEVKQSAVRQITTEEHSEKPSPPTFSIALKKVLMGLEWTELDPPRRVADLYVFAWHPIADENAADHRRADQWEFYVVREDALPNQKTITLNPIKERAQPVGYDGLADAVEKARAGLAILKKDTLP